MNRLTFAPHYAALLQSGRKTATLRLGRREELKAGTRIELAVGWSGADAMPLQQAQITDVAITTAGELTSMDLAGTSADCSTPEAARLTLANLYRREIRADDAITIVRFSLLG